jgi:hypothetical protein
VEGVRGRGGCDCEVLPNRQTTVILVSIFTYGRTVEAQSRQLSCPLLVMQPASRLPRVPLMVLPAREAALTSTIWSTTTALSTCLSHDSRTHAPHASTSSLASTHHHLRHARDCRRQQENMSSGYGKLIPRNGGCLFVCRGGVGRGGRETAVRSTGRSAVLTAECSGGLAGHSVNTVSNQHV